MCVCVCVHVRVCVFVCVTGYAISEIHVLYFTDVCSNLLSSVA